MGNIIYCVLADTHTHPLLHCNFVYSIMFDFFFFLINESVWWEGSWQREKKADFGGKRQTDLESSPSFATC